MKDRVSCSHIPIHLTLAASLPLIRSMGLSHLDAKFLLHLGSGKFFKQLQITISHVDTPPLIALLRL
jgi:hypothetical protein